MSESEEEEDSDEEDVDEEEVEKAEEDEKETEKVFFLLYDLQKLNYFLCLSQVLKNVFFFI